MAGLTESRLFAKVAPPAPAIAPPLEAPPLKATPLEAPAAGKVPQPPLALKANWDPIPDVVEKVSPGVVNISSTTIYNYQVFGMDEYLRLWGIPQERKQTSLGSGFIIDKDGYVITNNHVVDKASEVLITLFDKRQFKARIVGKDGKMDVALLQLQTREGKVPPNLLPVPLANSEKVRIGQMALAMGIPLASTTRSLKALLVQKNRTIGLGPLTIYCRPTRRLIQAIAGGPSSILRAR
jgi:S1-C subfamily serine protease